MVKAGQIALVAALIALACSVPAWADAPGCSPAPLLQPGKTQLLERVLVRPDARLSPDGTIPAAANAPIIPAFSVLYVYDHSPDGKAVRVGARSDCHPDGWLASDRVVPWRHTMVVAFANRTERDRAIFFDSADPVKALVAAPDAGAAATQLRDAAQTGDKSSGDKSSGDKAPNVVALEPETLVDLSQHFYLLPVLEAQTIRFATHKPARLLKIAALSTPSAAPPASPASPPASPPDVRRNFRTAIVFVVDATKSTEPYIDRTRDALDRIYARIEAAHLENRVRFGLIGYRDDPAKVPGIGYLTRIFVDPNKIATRADFRAASAGLTSSAISSRAEAEDGYAGVLSGIDGIDWSDFSGRFLVMVTDAASRDPGPLASTEMTAKALSLAAREKKIALMTLHLLTPQGSAADHETGRREYSEMTQWPGRGPLYYPVPTGDVAGFGVRVDALADSLVNLVETAEREGSDIPADPKSAKPPETKTSVDAVTADVTAIGHAMRLAYLGSLKGTTAPPMFEAWTTDRDYANPAIASLDVRVLLSKSQLSDLAATVSAIATAFENSEADSSTLYAQLRSAAATLSRDPARLGRAENQQMTAALLGEYLDGLPYTSEIMAIDEEAWRSMLPSRQRELIDGLAVKSRLYRRIHDDAAHWIKLANGADDADAVYPVPFDVLP